MPAHPEYRREWVAAGYRENMASAIACRPPSAPLFRVYHLTSSHHAISDIALGRLKVARFSDLNDPFELLAVNLRERQMREPLRDFKNAYGATTGLLSFSEDWADPILWSHYAEKHRGICLGFDVPRDSVQRVRYEDERIRTSLDSVGDPQNLVSSLQDQLLCTKYKHWEYEQEYRRFVPLEEALREDRLHFVSFDDNLKLAEVILGHQCSLTLERTRALLSGRYPTAIAYKARLAFGSFHVVPREDTVP